ncbi:MAG: hypothetical protein KJ592_02685 [Nanoarchaeota archaeon]|nr:hypothetical protein [Nanoarchaeota archaeon]
MKRELTILVFLGLFLIGMGGVWASTSSATVNIGGCSFVLGDKTIGMEVGECASGDGYAYYCRGDDNDILDIMKGEDGCSMNNDEYVANSNLQFCCPSGPNDNFACNEDEETLNFVCEQRTGICGEQLGKGACNALGCIWFDSGAGEMCIPNTNNLGCSDYKSLAACADVWGSGESGYGSEFCGKTVNCNGEYYSIENCLCTWNIVTSKCTHTFTGSSFWIDTDPVTGEMVRDIFEFSTSFLADPCVDGKQHIEWSTTSSIVEGFDGAVDIDGDGNPDIPRDCNDVLEGAKERFCGEAVLKLPGFSLFALFASLFIIGMYYYFREEGLE